MFRDGKRPVDGLCILFVDCLSIREAAIIIVWKVDGADLGAFSATGAFIQIHKPWFLAHMGGEVAGIPLEFQQFCVG